MRIDYLQHRFEVMKCLNARNGFLMPRLIQIPYYIYLGKVQRSTALSATGTTLSKESDGFRIVNGLLTPESPFSSSNRKDLSDLIMPDMSIGESAWSNLMNKEEEAGSLVRRKNSLDTALQRWRLPYANQRVHKQFRTHIYGWTWEDPQCDIDRLDIKDGDSLLCITSAGDNILHYAIKADVEIHSVDMNPCQGHILELKLAASQALEYHDFWRIFGEGKHERFEKLLDNKIAPYLSAQAYSYWKANADQFSSNFFLRGYSGWAIRLARVVFKIAGVSKDVKKMITAASTSEQDLIWKKKLRPIMLNPAMRFILGSGFFCWNALGVPRNQLNCLLQDGDIADFISATLDPVPALANMKTGAYHYLLCLNGKYTRASCPLYLTPEAFAELKARNGQRTAGIKMHTDTILK
jgi:betaine lipid synthase